MKVFFAGPSLPLKHERAFEGIDLRGPAARGDLIRAVDGGAQEIALCDGFFGDRPSVGHKEILYALSSGVAVLGAASMGALRAVECAHMGMTGVGRIVEDYTSGRRVSDADVAVLHAPEELGWKPLTVALVDLETTLERSADTAVKAAAEALLDTARGMHFADRTFHHIVQKAGCSPDLVALLKRDFVSQKTIDVELALSTLRKGLVRPRIGRFEMTQYFQIDRAAYGFCT